jgi:uncharacterized repeat protein (TIGR03803 family)
MKELLTPKVFILIFLAGLFIPKIHGATLTTLFYFDGTNGASPRSKLEFGTDGKLYGTTAFGGIDYGKTSPPSGNGTVFRISIDGQFQPLTSFAGYPDAREPYAGLIEGEDGNFYGTTYYDGAGGLGTVYMITSAGVPTVIKSFVYDLNNGYETSAPLCLGTDSAFYGTTFYGGSSGYGTVFRVQTNGLLTTLCSFPSTDNYSFSPNAGLVQGAGGLLYGTTFGAVGDNGTIFKITTSGIMTQLVSFAGTNGSHPSAELIFGRDGNLYGTTSGLLGGGNGTAFKVTTNGILNTLVFFAATNGANPQAPLTLADDGDLYGTTANGGPNGGIGTVFRIQQDGKLITLFSFHGTNGANPYGGLVQGVDKDFYGTTAFGGISNNGTIFHLSLKPIIQLVTKESSQIILSWNADPDASYQIQYSTNLTQSFWNNLSSILQATNASMNFTDTNTSDESRFYRVMLLP